MVRPPRLSPQTASILGELLESPGRWRYGYDLMQSTGLMAGTLYPILARLAEAGWLETEWGDPPEEGRPRRHLYRLTAAGRPAARDMVRRAAEVYGGARRRAT